jgi:hypothetical protein
MTLEEMKAVRNFALTLTKDLTAEISAQEQQPETPKLERWEPNLNAFYWIICNNGEVDYFKWTNDKQDNDRNKYFNCFQTKEEARQEALRTRARRKLEWLARELNAKSKPYQIVGFTLTPDFGVTVQEYNPPHLAAFYFNRREDAEYALSQMTTEELEALK